MIEIYFVIPNISNGQLFIGSTFVWNTDLSVRRNKTQLSHFLHWKIPFFVAMICKWTFLMQSRSESLNDRGQRKIWLPEGIFKEGFINRK